MENFITTILRNFTLTLLIISILCIFVSLWLHSEPLSKAKIIDIMFSWFLVLNIGINSLYNFIMHTVFGDMTAQFIGWPQSPFQLEVGFASLGFAVVGIISFWSKLGFRAATVIAPALFLWGAAGVHIHQMINEHNFAPGNAGTVFWTDIFLPIIGLTLLWLQYKNPVTDNA